MRGDKLATSRHSSSCAKSRGGCRGRFLFLILLLVKVVRPNHFRHLSALMLSHLALFFIPPAVMILDSYEEFLGDAWKIILLLVISNILVMGVTGWVVQKFLNDPLAQPPTPEEEL